MVAPRKSSSALSLIPEERSRNMPSSSKSTESLYSTTSSSKGSATILYRRNAAQGSNARQGAFIPATTEVRQRVLSARRLRIKTFQNQLADAQQHIAELAHENRILRTLHKRQDLALSKYENTNAELPQLLHSHAEEVRVWQMKYRNLQAQNKELLYKLKQKEGLVLSLSDQNKHLSQLNKDKNLEERQRLADKVQQLEARLQEKETDMKLLTRRLQLESKNSKKELQVEQRKRKDAMVQLEKVKLELSGYVKIDELNLNDKLSKLSIGSMSNITNGSLSHGNDEKYSISHTALTPLKKKQNDGGGDQSSRSAASDITVSTSRTARKLTASKMGNNTSTLLGGGDGPSDDDQSVFIKSVGMESKFQSQDKIDSKVEDNHFYDDDYEDEDEDDDNGDLENLLEITKKESSQSKIPKPSDMSYIRKEITEDYKERESFLNAFCRQATPVDVNKKPVNVSRKSKLLAALKAIDGSNSQD